MKQLFVLIALTTCACERQVEDRAATAVPAASDPVIPAQAPSSKPPGIVPIPKNQSELDRMILAGYTPHGTHLHAPGVKECPLAQGKEAVM